MADRAYARHLFTADVRANGPGCPNGKKTNRKRSPAYHTSTHMYIYICMYCILYMYMYRYVVHIEYTIHTYKCTYVYRYVYIDDEHWTTKPQLRRNPIQYSVAPHCARVYLGFQRGALFLYTCRSGLTMATARRSLRTASTTLRPLVSDFFSVASPSNVCCTSVTSLRVTLIAVFWSFLHAVSRVGGHGFMGERV